ncbi:MULTISPECIES: YoaK family protein [Peptoniphilus]|uniref:YoaK family protein n=1 Tax=Peptoniphilus TaxID=162289 RepID=UPI0008DB01E4|nr:MULTISPECIES: YoaK family protein [Peptoniphilus]MDU5595308.1 YoaK family protein [Peptoniphilus rhinitidis]
MKSYENLHETFLVLVFITIAGGFQDAYSYLMRGKVFANAQTGNIVLLFKNVVDLDFRTALSYLIPVISFALGVYIAVRFEDAIDKRVLHWRQYIIILEVIIMITVSIIPENLNDLANALLSFSCAMQVYAFKKIYGLNFATTMCIGNLRSATENLSKYHITKNKDYLENAKKYYTVIFIFGMGAALGYITSELVGLKSILIAAILLTVSFVILFFEERGY